MEKMEKMEKMGKMVEMWNKNTQKKNSISVVASSNHQQRKKLMNNSAPIRLLCSAPSSHIRETTPIGRPMECFEFRAFCLPHVTHVTLALLTQ